MMADMAFAVQDAIFDRLAGAIALPLAQVYQHVPDGTQPPVVIIGKIDVQDEGGKDCHLARITAEIECFFRGPGRKGLFQIMATVKAALDGQPLDQSAANLSRPGFVAQSDELLEDGITYYGTMSFEILAQPND